MAQAKHDKQRPKAERDEHSEGSRAAAEAHVLLAELRDDLEILMAFVAKERAELDNRPPSAKRLARLRLMSQDIVSARTFARKNVKQ